MIKYLKNRFETLFIFIPLEMKNYEDGVKAIFEYLKSRICYFADKIILKKVQHNISDTLGEHKIIKTPQSIILYAHPDKNFKGFIVDSDKEKILTIDWWLKKNSTYKYLYAHVCNGSVILNKNNWKKVFPLWISYSVEIKCFIGSLRGIERWQKVWHKINKISCSSNDLIKKKNKIKAVYLKSLGELYDSYNPEQGDALNLMYLTESYDSISTSLD